MEGRALGLKDGLGREVVVVAHGFSAKLLAVGLARQQRAHGGLGRGAAGRSGISGKWMFSSTWISVGLAPGCHASATAGRPAAGRAHPAGHRCCPGRRQLRHGDVLQEGRKDMWLQRQRMKPSMEGAQPLRL